MSILNAETSVFSRTKTNDEVLSPAKYNFAIGAVLSWGLFLNYLMVQNIPVTALRGVHPGIFFLAYFASCFFGIFLFSRSSNPFVSFIGYNFVVIPFGFVINLAVSHYSDAVVLDAIKTTSFATVAMMLLGTAYPKFFAKIHTALFISLLLVIIVELVEIFFIGKHNGALDWVVVLIFFGYIGYDWGRANNIPKTLDNAVDSAAAIYMDIINLFLRLLRILGRRN